MVATKKSSVPIRRGDIFCLNLGSNEAGGKIFRPVLVIQNDIGNRFCDTVIVVPLTTEKKAKKLFFTVLIESNPQTGLLENHVALFSQIRTIDRKRFTNDNYLGRIDEQTVRKVDEAIQLSLGLSTLQKLQDRRRFAKDP